MLYRQNSGTDFQIFGWWELKKNRQPLQGSPRSNQAISFSEKISEHLGQDAGKDVLCYREATGNI